MTKSRVACLVALTWFGAQGCIFAKDEACSADSDCASDQVCSESECVGAEPGGEMEGKGGSSSGQPGPACTTETVLERIKDFSGGVPTPTECTSDVLSGDYTGRIAPFATAYLGKGRQEVVATIDGSTLTSLDGVPCVSGAPGEVSGSMAFGSEEYECEQKYACGCCEVEFKRSPLGLPGEEARRDVWSVKKSGVECHIGIMNTEYYFNIDFEDVPDPPDPIIPPNKTPATTACPPARGCLRAAPVRAAPASRRAARRVAAPPARPTAVGRTAAASARRIAPTESRSRRGPDPSCHALVCPSVSCALRQIGACNPLPTA